MLLHSAEMTVIKWTGVKFDIFCAGLVERLVMKDISTRIGLECHSHRHHHHHHHNQLSHSGGQCRSCADCDYSAPLGMISGDIQDWQLSASSSYPQEWDKNCHERYARLYQANGRGWCARYKTSSEWLQVDLGVAAKVSDKRAQVTSFNRRFFHVSSALGLQHSGNNVGYLSSTVFRQYLSIYLFTYLLIYFQIASVIIIRYTIFKKTDDVT